jgi:hypothetical protein
MKIKITKLIIILSLFGAVASLPGSVMAQVDKTCTSDTECAGPGAVCVPKDTNNPTAGGKNCRNYFCSSTAVRVLDASGKEVADKVLEAGGYLEITSKAKYDMNSFTNAFYNNDHHYPSDPNQGNGTARGIEVTKAHYDAMQAAGINSGSHQALADGNYQLLFTQTGSGTSNVMKIPAIFFYTKDQSENINKYATSIQINSYFGAANPSRFSVPESACVTYVTFDPTSFTSGNQPTKAPANASCPSGAACNASNVCSCKTGYYNCDNNWTNGCESASRCGGGQVCTSGSDCLSGTCTDHICTGVTQPTRTPSGGSCNDNSQCGNGYTCQSNICMPTYCDATHTCPADYSCKQGVCFPGTCDAQHPCAAGYSCNSTGTTAGQCAPSTCRADTPCPPGYLCQNDGSCKKDDGAGSCSNDAACKTNGQCINNTCFCKTGTYNCDRDWANGCEATKPCAGSGTAQLDIKVKFNGIGANLPPVKDTQKVKVILANKYLTAPVSKEAEFTISGQSTAGIRVFEGTVDFTNIPFGQDYSVFIKGGQQIQKRICDNQPTETVDGRYYCTIGKVKLIEGTNTLDFSNIYQLGGDLPVSNEQSGFVDSVDITYIRSNLGNKDPNVVTVGDLNFDGIVDTQDYSIALYSLSFKYDEDVIGNE